MHLHLLCAYIFVEYYLMQSSGEGCAFLLLIYVWYEELLFPLLVIFTLFQLFAVVL